MGRARTGAAFWLGGFGPPGWFAAGGDGFGRILFPSAKLEAQWRQKDQTIVVHNLLHQLQSIRLGRLELGGKPFKAMVTEAPKDLNDTLARLDLLTLFAKPPAWTKGRL